MTRPVHVQLDPTGLVRWFGVSILALALAHLATQTLKHGFDRPFVYGLVDLFDLGLEANLPTFFSGVQLLVCATVLAILGRLRRAARDPYARHWLVLSAIFVYLAADELAGLHELTIRPVRELAPSVATGLLWWSWVIPGLIAVIAVATAYLRFVFGYLPADLRRRTLIGAALFVAGAIFVEMPEARHAQRSGTDNLTYSLYVLLEEVLEMTGILVFLSGLLRHVGETLRVIVIERYVPPAAAPQPAPAVSVPPRRKLSYSTLHDDDRGPG